MALAVALIFFAGVGWFAIGSRTTNAGAAAAPAPAVAPAASAEVAPPFAAIPNSIAVLPFADLSPEKDMEYFADGIAEELMTSLASTGKLRVIGRSSAFALKGTTDDARAIGARLRVSYLLEGSVRKDGHRLRISAQLTRTSDGISMWSQTYERMFGDVLDLQGSIAQEVMSALRSSVLQLNSQFFANLDARRTTRPAAYAAYLRGIHFYGRRTAADFVRAGEEFTRAVEIDSKFALAHAWLARTYNRMSTLGLGDVARNRARASESLATAMQIDRSVADLWWVQANFSQGDNTPLAARAINLERALAVSPGEGEAIRQLSTVYFAQGKRALGLQLMRSAHEMDPLWPEGLGLLGMLEFLFNGDKARTLELAWELESLVPSSSRGPMLRAWIPFIDGRSAEWDALMVKAIEVAPLDYSTHRWLAIDYAELGLRDAALHHSQVARRIAPENAAQWYIAARAELIAGNLDAAGRIVDDAMREKPEDYQSLLAQAEYRYFTNDCAGALQSMSAALPNLAQPEQALDLTKDAQHVANLVWCLRRQGKDARADVLMRVLNRCYAPPLKPGVMEGALARAAAAAGDRDALIRHLSTLIESKSMQFAFVRHDPLLGPWLKDREVMQLFERSEAMRAEWRKTLPLAPTRVPIPDA